MERDHYPTFSRSYYLTEKNISVVRDDIEKFLKKEDIPGKTIVKIMITVEELMRILLRKNQEKKTVVIQFSTSVRKDRIYIFQRDNGAAYDLTDTDADVESFEQYVYHCMLQAYERRQYLLTVDYNRSVFSYAVTPETV